ncbi:MAG: hypothetical protein GY739_01640 [Mesoflavibacter sp.]|nr:hypothetical protein [Mesoflavibacter sp.]
MISTIILIVIINGISSIVENLIQQSSGWTIYPPLSAGIDLEQIEQEAKLKNNNLNIISNLILIIQISLLVFLAYCGFKTGTKFNKRTK